MIIATNLKVAIPCIVLGGALGALLGSANGVRVGIVMGGVVAFLILLKKQKKPSAS
jgi:fructose-specific phosphotransferase system IIC component